MHHHVILSHGLAGTRHQQLDQRSGGIRLPTESEGGPDHTRQAVQFRPGALHLIPFRLSRIIESPSWNSCRPLNFTLHGSQNWIAGENAEAVSHDCLRAGMISN